MKLQRVKFKLFFILFALCLSTPGAPARAEDCGCNPLKEVFKAQILMAEKERYAAMTKPDVATLAPMLSSDLVYAHSTGKLQSKTELLADLKSGAMRYRKIDASAPMVRFYSEIAIVNGVGDFEVSVNNRDQKARLLFTAVYFLKGEILDRRWQLTSWHSSAIPESK